MSSQFVTVVTKDNFKQEVLESKEIVLIDFYADWCGPCKSLAPTLEKFAMDNAGKVKVVKVNVDKDPDLAHAFGIKSIPTLMVMKENVVVGKAVGNVPLATLDQLIEHAKKNYAEYLKQKPNALDKNNKKPPANGLNDNKNNKPPKTGM